MRISGITITDTYGTRAAKFAPGTVTIIRGPNGSGKSSILRALSYVFEGGTDPSVIRAGADQSVVEFRLDDGTVVSKTTRPKKSRKGGEITGYTTDLEVTQPDGTPRPAPKTFVDELSAASAVDPGSILRIDATTVPGRKALAEVLLQIIRIEFTPGEILGTAERPQSAITDQHGNPVPDGRDPLAVALPPVEKPLDLDGYKKYCLLVTEQRRRQGQLRDDSAGAINRLMASLPEGEDGATDYAAALITASETRRKLESDQAEALSAIKVAEAEAVGEASTAAANRRAGVNRDIDEQIAVLEKRRAEDLAAIQRNLQAATAQINQEANAAREQANAEYGPQITAAVAEVSRLQEAQKAHARAATIREEIEIQRATCQSAGRQYEDLSEVLDRLAKLRQAKLDALPVPGLEVSGESVLVDGIPWQNVNTARRVEVALQLCALRSGKLGFLLLDDAEHLDAETRRAIEDGIRGSGYQLLEAVVSDQGGLTIDTGDGLGVSVADVDAIHGVQGGERREGQSGGAYRAPTDPRNVC